MTIAAKRNALFVAASGDVVVHFDDDDYHAPDYIEAMLSLLARENADLVRLYGFYLYHVAIATYGY